MKIQFTSKDLVSVPDRAYTFAEHELSALEELFLAEPDAAMEFTTAEEKYDVALTIQAGSAVFRADRAAADLLVAESAALEEVHRQMVARTKCLAGSVLAQPKKGSKAAHHLEERDRFQILSI